MEFKFAALDSKRFNLRPTGSSIVLSAAGEKWSEPAEAAAADSTKGRDKQRLIQSSGPRIASGGKIGPAFKAEKSPKWLDDRSALFDRLLEKNAAQLAAAPKEPIAITLPDGAVKEGVSFQTTPMDIAQSISSSLAKKVIVAKVNYTRRLGAELNLVDPEEEDEPVDLSEALQCVHAEQQGELWDMTRPLEGDCKLSLLTFNDADGRTVFWHSSAHLLGECLEEEYGVKLCIGPPTEQGFYYDAYMGKDSINEADYKRIQQAAQKIIKEKQVYERVVLSKEEALELFADNPFKVQLITNKVPDGSHTTAYRCGKLVDLCRGPHIPSTANVKAFEVVRNSAAYWLGNAGNDSLQRVYAVSFPEAKLLKTWKKQMAEAKERDHRTLGQQYELFFFHELSPGCCFFLPNGAFIYNKLISFIRSEYRKRGFREVVTPNVFNIDLWKISGHAEHYLDNMFTFDAENQTFGLKPMNCPGHCLLFDHRVRSHRELPLRLADFGVLHRNEYSGALSGLTRVRRFQQDDAHIFCRKDQIEQEVRGALEFMESVYGTLGFTYELDLSTRPAKALGDRALWDEAEAMMKNALDQFGHKWALNPGDGAFYGPKIDIKVYDALGRRHQCATIQLDFQLPIRFKLKYKASDPTAGDGSGYERPVMVHRAILGSVERMMAVLLEHCGGKWPFWLSPRQAIVVPVAMEFMDYAHSVAGQIHAAGFECDVEDSTKTLQKKIRESQLAQYNFILVVGGDEQEGGTVNVRTRDNQRHGTKPLAELIAQFHKMAEDHE